MAEDKSRQNRRDARADTRADARAEGLRRDIDENLKRVFEASLDPEIPDRFKDLLAQLKARGASR
ncbi:NepR family anti-sigma factor [Rhodobacter capsulatus]|uniref:NepR family anti-sigma factor n=1 Tax=Rhodobacter capsulatus TaxID=1061 RepID=UPI0003D2F628|nr:NepR family anti-sigma factor [Rhodobacter capsulatus]ETD81401.1 regulator [Rhodobacter capsulatus YW1]